MNGLNKRREADIERLQLMADASQGQLSLAVGGAARDSLRFTLRLPTAGSSAYPEVVQPETRFEVRLPARYPFEAPTAHMQGTPIFHPNVFASGVICVGSRWQASEGLDIYIRRLAQLLCFDPMLVNLQSIAHASAGRWYEQARKKFPASFPTARINWALPGEKVIRSCPACKAKLRLPAGRQGVISCPRCQHEFAQKT